MINEDKLVEKLNNLGFIEIFTENLSTEEKIVLFMKAEIIIGSIGGGMANLLFSTKNTKAIILVTPFFLDINYRFQFSFYNSNYIYFNDIITYRENNEIPLFCRVKIKNTSSIHHNKIGEIIDYKENKYLINISNNDISGFNNNYDYIKDVFYNNEFELLDKGLNSPFIIDIDKFIYFYNLYLNT